MSRSRALLLAASVAVGGAALATASPASAEPVAELNALCLRKGGQVIWSPYSLARCQSARNNKGFEQEQILCEVGLDGTFVVAQLERMSRSTWACFDF